MKFSKTHEWLSLDQEESKATFGITEHAQNLLGDLVFVELPEVGQTIRQGEEIAVVESVKAASDVYSPVSGTITQVNDALHSEPGLINQDPFKQGWMIEISFEACPPSEIKKELQSLMDETTYQNMITEG